MPTFPGHRPGERAVGGRPRRLTRRLAVPGLLAVGATAALPALTAAAANPQVTVATVPGVGKVLASGHRVLYVHTGDTRRHSTCTGVCAIAWPPLLVSSRAAHHLGHLHGLGTFPRTRGHLQVTIDGHPLYFFAGDKTLTGAKGQGFANAFFTVRPNGTAVHVAPAASPGVPGTTSTTSTPPTTSTTSTPTPPMQGSHGTQPPAPVPAGSPAPTNPPATTTTSPPTTTTTPSPPTTTTAPSGGGVSF